MVNRQVNAEYRPGGIKTFGECKNSRAELEKAVLRFFCFVLWVCADQMTSTESLKLGTKVFKKV